MATDRALGAHMRREILEQPDVVARVLEREWGAASRLGRELRRRDVRFAVLAARGTSDHAATLGKYVFGCELGIPAALAAPSIVTLYRRPLRLGGAAVFGVSQSGRSPDIVEFVRQAARGGAVTIGVTNDPGSPLARAARHCLLLHAGPERSVAATKTFTAELACLYLLAAGWKGGAGGAELLKNLGRAPAYLRDAMSLEGRIAEEASKGRRVERCVVVGRGFAYPVALEIALKLKEAAGVFAEGASAADFLHGPIGMARRQAGDRFRALLLLSRGPGLPMMKAVEKRLAHAGVSMLRLGPPPSPDMLSPFPLAAWGQLAALHLALQKGRDPDKPDGLRKVTRTK